MTLRYIEIFLALARTPNMREVASRLYISQAGVSSAIREFESELGVSLFDRVGRGVRLNEKGRLLSSNLSPLYRQLNDSLAIVVSDVMVGDLRLGASTTLADYVLPQILYDFKKKHSLVSISFDSASTKEIVQRVEDGTLDMGFVEGDVHSLKTKVMPLSDERLVIVTSDRDFAEAGPYPIASLTDGNWLIRQEGSGTRNTFLASLMCMGLSPKIFLEFSNNDAIKSVLYNKGTLACLSPLVVASELRRKEFFIVPVYDVEFSRTFKLVTHRECSITPLLQSFSDAVQATFNLVKLNF
ncbi:LysR substrate-binding domain-containing protein [Desulfovibrio sp. UCD-KL4C]|uniref:LysR substrate-binding domain-containing protein n=1 Tax=Desulfovibrio sp. UCD-KL4C TaxID=2578120 RepID=UPI0025B95AAA|nr:LysR substrate-binding domain-containing protein [Desulfovibrio sp. UCD-KL4C]